MSSHLSVVLDFLGHLGLPVHAVSRVPEGSFMATVFIRDGGLEVLPQATVADVLHEAGHLAVIPSRFRTYAQDDVDQAIERMFEALADEADDTPLMTAAMHAGETEATAWAWAVGCYLGLPSDVIIQDADYDGTGADIRTALTHGAYQGIQGIGHAGFCARGARDRAQGRPTFPTLAYWLQA